MPTDSRLLFSWIGATDLACMASDLDGSDRDSVLRDARREIALGGLGPIKTLLSVESFERVHLLTNYTEVTNRLFARWLGCKPITHKVEIQSPINYGEVFQATDEALGKVVGTIRPGSTELCIHLSSGTPAMAAVWVLLGKTKYPATFYQTVREGVSKEEIPFDIILDYVPEILRGTASSLQQLSSQSPQEIGKGFESIIGSSKAIRLAAGRASRAALWEVPVLVLGESGTGKEMFANAIHQSSSRRDKSFHAVNCAAMPSQLLESILFGHAKGAFTGAVNRYDGLFKTADGGTIFLDEIGECEPEVQAKLLRVLQPPPGASPCFRVFNPLGSTKDETSDVRIIAATNRNLLKQVEAGRFREDLYYRLAVITIQLPALRERKADIESIAEHLLEQINANLPNEGGTFVHKQLSPSTINFVRQYDWPGNVRQLQNALVQSAVMSESNVIQPADIRACLQAVPQSPQDILGHELGDGFSLKALLDDVQSHYLQRAMEEAGSVMSTAAELLGYESYQRLNNQLRARGLEHLKDKG
ncbi:MAG: sigma 54-interacting transcriptional regulator [Planctomycetota bacterium]|nr:sigma 54-interacting transcriptional regulator [Planctomycetota bacterium]